MLKQLVTKVMGTRFERELKRIQPIVDAIHGHEERLKGLSEADLQAQTASFRARLAERVGALTADVTRLKQEKHDCPDAEQRVALDRKLGEAEKRLAQETQAGLSHLLPEAFATVREASRRLLGTEAVVTGHALKWDMVPYDVQLIGGIVLHQGKIGRASCRERV